MSSNTGKYSFVLLVVYNPPKYIGATWGKANWVVGIGYNVHTFAGTAIVLFKRPHYAYFEDDD